MQENIKQTKNYADNIKPMQDKIEEILDGNSDNDANWRDGLDDPDQVIEALTTLYTEEIAKGKREAVEEFAKWFAGNYFSNIEGSVDEYLSQQTKGDKE